MLKMWILWKRGIWKCEFWEKCDFINVNFVKNETLKLWILSKMGLWKCGFLDKLRIFALVCLWSNICYGGLTVTLQPFWIEQRPPLNWWEPRLPTQPPWVVAVDLANSAVAVDFEPNWARIFAVDLATSVASSWIPHRQPSKRTRNRPRTSRNTCATTSWCVSRSVFWVYWVVYSGVYWKNRVIVVEERNREWRWFFVS